MKIVASRRGGQKNEDNCSDNVNIIVKVFKVVELVSSVSSPRNENCCTYRRAGGPEMNIWL